MNHCTKGIVAGCVGMMSGGFVNSLLASSELGISSLLKAGIVGFVAGAVVLLMLAVLPVRKIA